MEITYLTWGMLLFLFVGMLLVLRAKEGKWHRPPVHLTIRAVS